MNNIEIKDFRSKLYGKYASTFKKFIRDENLINKKSDYATYKKWYLPLINKFPPDAEVIDLGCGNGYMLNFLKEEGFRNLYGIDISDEQVYEAKRNGINAEVFNVFDFFAINKRKFNIIFALDIIEHFYKHELFDLFSGIFSLLNENGVLIIHAPNGDGIFPQHIIYGDLTHFTIFNPNSLGQILRLSGFSEIKFYETGPTTKNIKGLIRLILWKIIRMVFKSIRIIETGSSEKILTQDFICVAHKSYKNQSLK